MSGFVKLDRDAVEQLPTLLDRGLYATLLTRAAWKRCVVVYRGRTYALERGQLVISVRDLAADLGASRSAINRALDRMQGRTTNRTTIVVEPGPHATIITVCNYGDISDDQEECGPQADHTPDHIRTTEQEEKKEEYKNPPYSPPQISVAVDNGTSYAWTGRGKRRLNHRDYGLWRDRFPNLDLDDELHAIDAWCADNPDKAKNWFLVAERWLVRANKEAAGGSAGRGSAEPSWLQRP